MSKLNKTIIVVVSILVILDQITKQLIVYLMDKGDSVEVIKDFFYISSHRNTGGAWGILTDQMVLFYFITFVALILFYFLIKDMDLDKKRIFSYGVMLMIAGAIGNFIDRLLFKEVVDFLDFYLFDYDFPIFNIADICLTVGVGLFTVDIMFFDAKRPKNISKWSI